MTYFDIAAELETATSELEDTADLLGILLEVLGDEHPCNPQDEQIKALAFLNRFPAHYAALNVIARDIQRQIQIHKALYDSAYREALNQRYGSKKEE